LKSNKLVSWLLVIVLVLSGFSFVFAADNIPTAKVVFKASIPDANGVFTATLTVYNATFNAFQFAFSYNAEAISPVDSTGVVASAFTGFGTAAESTSSWMNPVGNKFDSQLGLFECGGYANPGSGSVTADASGMLLYTFTFRKTGTAPVTIRLATEASGAPFNPSIPEGGGLAEGGYNVDTTVEIQLPTELGESVVDKIVSPVSGVQADVVDALSPKALRLRDTIILQIANGTATKDGELVRIDGSNILVKPYIDENDRTMVPVRFIAEAMGATVAWNGLTEQITITYQDKVILMTVGSKEFKINGVVKNMDTTPVINKGWDRTMVPVRFIAETFDRDVKWDPDRNLVIISPLADPWDPDGAIEKEVMTNVMLLLSPLMQKFV